MHLTEEEKALRYCTVCKKRDNHTSLDHRLCPIKRQMLRERARIARQKRTEEQENSKRDKELIRQAINLSDRQAFPELISNEKQHQTMAAIISLALLDEASTKGSFNRKLEEGCKNNGLPTIKYNLEPQTATKFFNAMTANAPNLPGPSRFPHSTTSTPSKFSRHYRDSTKRQDRSGASSSEDDFNTGAAQLSKKRNTTRPLPEIKIIPATQPNLSQDAERNTSHMEEPRDEALEIIDNLIQELENNYLILKTDTHHSGKVKDNSCSVEKLLRDITGLDILNNKDWLHQIKKDLGQLCVLGYQSTVIPNKYILKKATDIENQQNQASMEEDFY